MTLQIIVSILLQWVLTYFVDLIPLIILSMGLLFAMSIASPSLSHLIFISGMIGFFSDLLLNLYSRKYGSDALQSYFDSVGPITSAMFAFCATAWMILNTLIIMKYLRLTPKRNFWLILFIGFIVGALWGAVGHYSKAMSEFKVFYDNTRGWPESRFWDGITVPVVLLILFLIPGAL